MSKLDLVLTRGGSVSNRTLPDHSVSTGASQVLTAASAV